MADKQDKNKKSAKKVDKKTKDQVRTDSPIQQKGQQKAPSQVKTELGGQVGKETFKCFNFGRLFLGLFLIFIGLALLGETTGLYHIEIDFWSLWPVLIIALGLSLLSRQGWLSFFIAVVVIVLVLALIVLSFYLGSNSFVKQRSGKVETELVSIPYLAGAKVATIKIKTGAGKLSIDGGGVGLVSGHFDSNFLKLKVDSKLRDGVQEVSLETQGNWRTFMRRPRNDLDLSISSTLPVDLYLDAGAMKMEIDLTEVRARTVEIKSGASSLRLALGDLVENSEVRINSGASSIDISVPSSVGTRLEIEGGLISKDLSGFEKIEEGIYETENYQTADKKIDIFLDIGVSSLKVYQD